MPIWAQVIGTIVAAIGGYVGIRKWRREDRNDDRDRVAAYLDRIATMLAEMADDFESGRTSPARCQQLFEAIGGVDRVLHTSRTALAARDNSELLEALREVVDPPDRLRRTRSLELVRDVGRLLETGAARPSDPVQVLRDLESIRTVSGLFKGAADLVRAL